MRLSKLLSQRVRSDAPAAPLVSEPSVRASLQLNQAEAAKVVLAVSEIPQHSGYPAARGCFSASRICFGCRLAAVRFEFM